MSRFSRAAHPVILAWVLLIAGSVSSCTLAPARLKQVRTGRSNHAEARLHSDAAGWKPCFDLIEKNPDSPEGQRSLIALMDEGRRRLSKTPGIRQVDLAPDLQLEFSPGSVTTYAHDYFEELIPASTVTVVKLTHHRREGIGLPLIGRRENTGREPIEAYYPPEAITRPVTAVAEIKSGKGGKRRMIITLYSPLCQDTILFHGRRQPLAAEITASFVALLERTGKLRATGLTGFLRPTAERKPQLYLMEPYDPKREPLILVHGLLSTPLTWATLTNELWGDPEVRRRYQIWHYHYPTSAPFLYSASVFRHQLRTTLGLVQAQGHREIRPITIIAHSMGGLISKTLITDSGGKIWDTIMAVPPGQMKGSAEDLAAARHLLHWKASKKVKRVIFVCVPHRGSPVSAGLAGRIGTSLSALPDELTSLWGRLIRDNPEATTEAFRQTVGRGRLTSIQTLSPKHPVLPVLNALPVAPWVTTHSIIGNRGRPGLLETSSDGVVPYSSSHWPSAVSEKIVPAGHSAARNPEAIKEMKRILILP